MTICRKCKHKIKIRKGKYVHDNSPYDNLARCRKCITKGKYCRIAKG